MMLQIMNKTHGKLFKIGLSNMNVRENCKLLDVGFGGGKALKAISKRYENIKLFGIDFSDVAIKVASKNNKKDIKTGKMILLKADIEFIPFRDNSFDVITAFQTHYHWRNMESKMKEIYRVLNENGQFLIVAEKYKINYHMQAYKTEREMKELLLKTGYKNIEYQETKYDICMKGVKNKTFKQ
jgi:ubiquinone/menaquinone biosynthesis C-methylase UbiE